LIPGRTQRRSSSQGTSQGTYYSNAKLGLIKARVDPSQDSGVVSRFTVEAWSVALQRHPSQDATAKFRPNKRPEECLRMRSQVTPAFFSSSSLLLSSLELSDTQVYESVRATSNQKPTTCLQTEVSDSSLQGKSSFLKQG